MNSIEAECGVPMYSEEGSVSWSENTSHDIFPPLIHSAVSFDN